MQDTIELFNLVKSLGGNEKRYLSMYANTFDKRSKGYMVLFDLLDKQKQFDEEAIKVALKKQGVKQRLSQLKRNLLLKILEVLKKFDLKKNAELELNDLYVNVQILINRGIYKEAEIQLYKAKKRIKGIQALEHIYVGFLKLEATLIMLRKISMTDKIEKMNYLFKEWYDCIAQSSEHLRMVEKTMEFAFDYAYKPELEKSGALYLERLQSFLTDLQQEWQPEKLTHAKAIRNYYLLRIHISISLGDMEGLEQYGTALVNYLSQLPEANIRFVQETQLTVWDYQLDAASKANDKDLFLDLLDKYPIDKNAIIPMQANGLMFQVKHFNLGIRSSFLNPDLKQFKQFKQQIDKNSPFLGSYKTCLLYFDCTVSLMHLKQYEKAIYWSMALINDHKYRPTEKFYFGMCALRVICQIELGELQWAIRLMDNLKKILTFNNRYYESHQLMCDMISAYITALEAHQKKRKHFVQIDLTHYDIHSKEFKRKEIAVFYRFRFLDWYKGKLEALGIPIPI